MRRTERTRPRWSATSPTPTYPACRARECRTANLGRSDGPADWRSRTPLRRPPSLPPDRPTARPPLSRSEEHTSELQSRLHLVCRLLLEKKKNTNQPYPLALTFSCVQRTRIA